MIGACSTPEDHKPPSALNRLKLRIYLQALLLLACLKGAFEQSVGASNCFSAACHARW